MFGTILHSGKDIIVFVLLFGFSIFVHELGHFLMALRCGMVVDTFSLGFGPAMWKRKIRGVVYKIGWIPFGGYVALPQLDPSGMATIQGSGDKGQETGDRSQSEQQAEEVRQLPPISAGKKILVSIAGAMGNVVFAILVACVIYLSPYEPPKGSPMVGYVKTNSAAYTAGLRAGDRLLAVNGRPVNSWLDFMTESHLGAGSGESVVKFMSNGEEKTAAIPLTKTDMGVYVIAGIAKVTTCKLYKVFPDSVAEKAGLKEGDVVRTLNGTPVLSKDQFIDLVSSLGDQEVKLTLERGDQPVALSVVPKLNPTENRSMIGVWPIDVDDVVAWMQYKSPWDQIKYDAMGIARILQALGTPKESKQAAEGLGGPVLILIALWGSIKISLLNGLGFIRFLNVNLAILNLLPIPVLDGGHVVFALWEGITRRRVHPKVVNTLVNVFATLLIGAMLILTYRDVVYRLPHFLGFGKDKGGAKAKTTAEAVTNSQPASVEKAGE